MITETWLKDGGLPDDIVYRYDRQGRLVEQTWIYENVIGNGVIYTIDEAGRVTHEMSYQLSRDPQQPDTIRLHRKQYFFNEAGQVVFAIDSVTWRKDGQVKKSMEKDSIGYRDGLVVHEYSWYERENGERMTIQNRSWTISRDVPGETLLTSSDGRFTKCYAPGNRLTREEGKINSQTAFRKSYTYSKDSALVRVEEVNEYQNGTKTTITTYDKDLVAKETVTWVFRNPQTPREVWEWRFEYDKGGKLISRQYFRTAGKVKDQPGKKYVYNYEFY